jgi:PAS domain S-box-containing protein
MSTRKQTTMSLWSIPIVKRSFLVFLPLFVIIIIILLFHLTSEIRAHRLINESNEATSSLLLERVITTDLKSTISDLFVISSHNALIQFLSNGDIIHLNALKKELLSFSREKKIYDQLRVLDETGMEILRVNYNNGNPLIVPDKDLQSKAHRYYFSESFTLGPSQIFISKFDLNIENNLIETPLKPMIRLGIPIFDIDGKKRGIVVINYLGENLIKTFVNYSSLGIGESMLLESEGYWLKGQRQEDEWGFMYPDRNDRKFGNYYPEAWNRIKSAKSGQFRNEAGLFTFRTIYPFAVHLTSLTSALNNKEPINEASKGLEWKIVSHIHQEKLNASTQNSLIKVIPFLLTLTILITIGSWIIAVLTINRSLVNKELSKVIIELKELESIVNRSPVMAFLALIEEGETIEFATNNVKQVLGYSADEFTSGGVAWEDIIHSDDVPRLKDEVTKYLERGILEFDQEYRLQKKSGETRWMTAREKVLLDSDGNPTHIQSIVIDITEKREYEEKLKDYAETQTVLLREINHRVKNNLSAILSLLHKEEDRAEEEGLTSYIEPLRDLDNRIQGLLTVHSMLTSTGWRPLNLTTLCQEIVQTVLLSASNQKSINLDVTSSDISINSNQAHHLALVMNELATNTVKHASIEQESAKVQVAIKEDKKDVILVYRDVGPGFPEDVIAGTYNKTSIGFKLIKGIIEGTMHGKVELNNDGGAVTNIRFENELLDLDEITRFG